MQAVSFLTVAAITAQLLMGLLLLALSRMPRAKSLRFLGLAALAGSGYALCALPFTIATSDDVRWVAVRVQLLLGAFHIMAWYVYGAADARRPLTPVERAMIGVGSLFALAALVPGLVLRPDAFSDRTVVWLGATYRDTLPTPFGSVAFAFYCFSCATSVFLNARDARRGVPNAAFRAVMVALVFVGSVNDALAGAYLLDTPYILDACFLLAVAGTGGLVARRSLEAAQALERTGQKLAHAQQLLVDRERLAALGQMSAIVAHEVRNPLGVIFNALARLKQLQVPGEEAQLLVSVMGDEAERLNRMVGDLLQVARPTQPNRVDVELAALGEGAIAASRAQLDRPVEMSLQVAPGLRTAQLDPELMRRALVNLLCNAAQAATAAAPVHLRLSSRDARLVFEVSDAGPGVPPELRERIFEPFFTTRAKGTGLGLAVVHQVAVAHGGQVRVEPAQGGGARFVVEIPLGDGTAPG